MIEVTEPPHTGCVKFSARFGVDAHKFVNAKPYRHLRLRGMCAKVVEPGTFSSGDTIRKLLQRFALARVAACARAGASRGRSLCSASPRRPRP